MTDWRTLTLAAAEAVESALDRPADDLRGAVAARDLDEVRWQLSHLSAVLDGAWWMSRKHGYRDVEPVGEADRAVAEAADACRDAKRLPLAECGRRLNAKMREAG